MVTSAERGEDVRRRLVGAAVEAIPELGWHGVSTRTLARRAGVAPGLVHYHFASLEALLRQAALEAVRGELEAGAAALVDADGLHEGLAALVAHLDRYPGTDPLSLLFVETSLQATRDETLRAELQGLLRRFRQVATGWLAAHGTPDPAATAAVLAAVLDGLLLHRPLDPALRGDAVLPVLARLLSAPPSDEREH